MKIILLSHGLFAKEAFNTMKMIYGQLNDIYYQELSEGCDMEKYEQDLTNLIKQDDEEKLIITDVLGGSPYIISCRIYKSLDDIQKEKVRIITGMNMPMLLELANAKDNYSLDECCSIAENSGKDGIVDVIKKMKGNK